MALSPLDIKNKTFSTKMRGFSPDEVDEFLDQVVLDYEDVLRKKRELEKALKHANEKLSYFNELKDALNQSIIVAQDTADKLKDNASKESDIILTSAESQANDILTKAKEEANDMVAQAKKLASQIVDDATDRVDLLISETDDLKRKSRSFYRNLTLLLEEQLSQLQSKEWDEILKPFDSYATDNHQISKSVDNSEYIHSSNSIMDDRTATLAETLASLDAAGLLDEETKKKTTLFFPENHQISEEVIEDKILEENE